MALESAAVSLSEGAVGVAAAAGAEVLQAEVLFASFAANGEALLDRRRVGSVTSFSQICVRFILVTSNVLFLRLLKGNFIK